MCTLGKSNVVHFNQLLHNSVQGGKIRIILTFLEIFQTLNILHLCESEELVLQTELPG